jgi:hypothetical protein
MSVSIQLDFERRGSVDITGYGFEFPLGGHVRILK